MKILVLNSGSSSIKYQLFDMIDQSVLAKGYAQRIGIEDSYLEHKNNRGDKVKIEQEIHNHNEGIQLVIKALLDQAHGVLTSLDEIDAIGHRVVHGGEKFQQSTLITDDVIAQIQAVSDLAPLHNPHNLAGIAVCNQIMPNKPQVAVFDTVFHQTMESQAYTYALPYRYYQEYGVRRYGFHGTSHQYVTKRAAKVLARPLADLKLISCHLGNGASITAVKAGKSIDTSMGLTPLEGLVMGTRSGDLDPAIINYLIEKENLTISDVDSILNKQSGLLGISGISNDLRDIQKAAREGNKQAQIALDVFIYRIQKYIGAYFVALGGVDAIIFTAGVGENESNIRKEICDGLGVLNIKLDATSNQLRGEEACISTIDSSVAVLVIPTNEELMIAQDTKKIALRAT